MPKASKQIHQTEFINKSKSPKTITKLDATKIQPRRIRALAGMLHRPLPERVPKHELEEAKLMQKQFKERPVPIEQLVSKKLATLARDIQLSTNSFFHKAATFYDVDLLLTDQSRFFARLKLWRIKLGQSKQRSSTDLTSCNKLVEDSMLAPSTNGKGGYWA